MPAMASHARDDELRSPRRGHASGLDDADRGDPRGRSSGHGDPRLEHDDVRDALRTSSGHRHPPPEHDDVRDALRGPSPADARESLHYWRARLDGLPRRRRAARREARTMVLAWEERVRSAEIERWGGGWIGRVAGGVAVLRTVRPRALVRRAGRLVPRSLVVGVLTVVLGSVLLAGVLIGAILSALL